MVIVDMVDAPHQGYQRQAAVIVRPFIKRLIGKSAPSFMREQRSQSAHEKGPRPVL
jgi:hypothetical protein